MPMLVSAWANANIQIYPSKGIFGLEQPCRNDPSKYEANGSSIVCDFSQAIDNESIRKQVEQLFVQSLKQGFNEQIVDTISQKNEKPHLYCITRSFTRKWIHCEKGFDRRDFSSSDLKSQTHQCAIWRGYI